MHKGERISLPALKGIQAPLLKTKKGSVTNVTDPYYFYCFVLESSADCKACVNRRSHSCLMRTV